MNDTTMSLLTAHAEVQRLRDLLQRTLEVLPTKYDSQRELHDDIQKELNHAP